MKTLSSQFIAWASFYRDWRNFSTSLNELEAVQNKVLDHCLVSHPYLKNLNEFRNSDVNDYASQMRLLEGKNIAQFVRYQPTSGSGASEKIIPYTKPLMAQFQKAINPWLFELFRQHPKVLTGKHYWSLSWLPDHWREKGWMLDDSELLPSWKRSFLKNMLACPSNVSQAKSLEACQFATLAYLAASADLTFVSVWSPTFMLEYLKLLGMWKSELSRTLKTGKWDLYADDLGHLKAPLAPRQAEKLENIADLWPELSLISSWDSSTSAIWAQTLRQKFPKATFSSKGLWSTEGVVTIPFRGQHILSFHSHYYEFQDPKSGSILCAHEVKEGDELHPLITTANGFVRYNLKDRVRVTGHLGKVPCLEFLGRDGTLDLAGEKLSTEGLVSIVNTLRKEVQEHIFVSAFAINSPKFGKPSYHFLFQGSGECEALKARLTELLGEHFHYQLARELGQLGQETVYVKSDALGRYKQFQTRRGMVAGNIKPEIARIVSDQQEVELLYDCLT